VNTSRLARFLGWFSIGLGAAEIVAPATIARISGTRNHKRLVRIYGLREVAAGVGILTQPGAARWLWARVGGDAVDMASIIRGARRRRRKATVGALAAVAGVAALDIICAQRSTAWEKRTQTPQTV